MDKFRVEVIAQTPNPQTVIYAAMHQDYSDQFIIDERDQWPSETKCGEIIVKRLLAGERGHYGPLEHVQIVFNCGYFPHSVMQQARTHRVGISFDVQCLAADTEITFVNIEGETSPKLRKTIGELYDLWTNGEKAIRERSIRGRNGEPPGEYRRDCKNRIRKMRLRVLNEETGEFTTGSIKDVMCSGVQPVYRLALEDGKTLDCTVNHRLLTDKGWQTMGDALGLRIDDNNEILAITKECSVLCNGILRSDALYTSKNWFSSKVEQGLTANDIARICDVSPNTIHKWAKQHGIQMISGRKKGKKDIVGIGLYREREWLEASLKEGLYVDQMAELAGCSVETVKQWVYKHGLQLNKRKSGTRTPWNKGKPGYQLSLSSESRCKRQENSKKYTKRGEESHLWKGGTSTERMLIGAWTRDIAPQVHEKFNYICQKCGVRGGVLHAHHLIPVFADESRAYSFDNLISLCKSCHEFIHQNNKEAEFAQSYQPIIKVEEWQNKPKYPGNKLVPHPVKIVNVEYLGKQMTYDIEVEGKWHNFVANGLVVHNSFRYTGQQFIEVLEGKKDLEDVFYLRPVGDYTNRQGKKYYYSSEQRQADFDWCLEAVKRYQIDFENGMSEEHARGKLPFDYRQHFVVSLNLRTLLHFLDLRFKKDAQLEIQKLCELMWPHVELWAPEVAAWYKTTRMGKARLSP